MDETGLQLLLIIRRVTVSDGTADVIDGVYVNMLLDLWDVLEWVKQQGENSW